MQRLFVGMSGSSGIRYGRRLVQVLLEQGLGIDLCITDAAAKVLRVEEGIDLDPRSQEDLLRHFGQGDASALRTWRNDQVEAPAASGSSLRRGAVIIPCSMGTLGRVSHGYSSCLVERACDVALKEGSPLILVPRETPYSRIHLENMLQLVTAGAVILPASPGFYHHPKGIEDLVDHVVGKVLDRLGIEHGLFERWEGGDAG